MTNRLTIYLCKIMSASIGLICLAYLGLQLFVLYVNELGDIGHGHYGALQAFYFVLMSLPAQLYNLFPCLCLVGAMMGLGELAERSELTVMQSSGVSRWQITQIVLQLACVLVLIMSIFGETVVPQVTQFAENYKAHTSSRGQALRSKDGIWLRTGDAFIYIRQVIDAHHLLGIQQFRFNHRFVATESMSAESAEFSDDAWHLHHVELTQFGKDSVSSQLFTSMPWELAVNPAVLKVAAMTPSEMPVWLLSRYIHQQQKNHIDVSRYELELWERLLHPFTSMLMMLLAIPFVFGQPRSTMGFRLMLGISCGFGYSVLNRLLGPMSLVYQWPPIIGAMLPSILFLILAIILFRRTSRVRF